MSGDDFILLQAPANQTQSKEQKRQSVRDKGYHILFSIGDQLDDLAEVPAQAPHGKKQWVARHHSHFNRDWFILPNVLYGGWEEALAEGYRALPPAGKHQARVKALTYPKYATNTDPAYAQHILLADVWLQASADFHATAYQAFDQAKRVVRQQQKQSAKYPAVVVDIDGTLLDFIPIFGGPIHKNSPKDNRHLIHFMDEMQKAQPIPGAQAFLNEADQAGYDIFYITARPSSTSQADNSRDLEAATIKQLKQHSFPQIDHTHLIFRDEYCPEGQPQCGKEVHRHAVTSTPFQCV